MEVGIPDSVKLFINLINEVGKVMYVSPSERFEIIS
jgi:hypothetical protein